MDNSTSSNSMSPDMLIEGLDYYEPLPDTVLISFSLLAAVAALVNMSHLLLLFCVKKITPGTEKSTGNYKTFLTVLGTCDMLLSTARVVFSNKASQDLLLSNRHYCIWSAVFMHALLLIGATSILLISLDRLVAITKMLTYQSSFLYNHFSKVVIGVIPFSLVFYTIIGVVFRDIGFRNKRIGSCKFGSEKSPSLGMISVALVFIEFVAICVCCIELLRRNKRVFYSSKMLRQTAKRTRSITKTIIALVVCKLLTWLPIMSTLITRSLKLDCYVCELFGICTLWLNSLLNPLCYGLTNKRLLVIIQNFRKKSKVANAAASDSRSTRLNHAM